MVGEQKNISGCWGVCDPGDFLKGEDPDHLGEGAFLQLQLLAGCGHPPLKQVDAAPRVVGESIKGILRSFEAFGQNN